jgi:cell division protein FtsZ
MPLIEAFKMADDVLYNATRGISDLVTVHGLINLDFADVRTTMVDGGTALMGSAMSSGEGRAERAAKEAISSPLLDGISISGARNVLVNITAGPSLGAREATQAVQVVQDAAGDEAEVIFGTVIDANMDEDFRVTVIATGFEGERHGEEEPRVRRTVQLETPHAAGYKGEDSLKHLDVPAYERRTHVAHPPASELKPLKSLRDDDEEQRNGAAHIRRLEPTERRSERIRKDDSEVPAFLRKMMD